MKSQLELLQENIAELEEKYGPDNPLVKGLKEQIVGLENQKFRAEERERFSLSVRSSISPLPQQELEASSLYERLISQLPPASPKRATHPSSTVTSDKPVKNKDR